MAIEVDLAITNNCNLQCSHCCYSSGGKRYKDVPLEVIADTLAQLREMGGDELHLAGGEPFVRPDLPKIVSIGKQLGYTVQVLSNGYNITREKFEELKCCGLDRILFSVDDVGEHHDKFRNQIGVFASVIKSLQMCKELGFFTRVNTVVTNESMKRMPELNRILASVGVNRHSLFVLTPIGRGEQLSTVAPDLLQWAKFKEMMRDYALREKPYMEISAQKLFAKSCGESQFNTVCRIHERDDCIISATGDIYPCYIYTSTNIKLGNINERGIKEIWNDEEKWAQYPFFSPHKCSRCSEIVCNGGCSGYVQTVNQNVSDCDIRCKVEDGYVPDCVRVYEQLWKGNSDD